ncbi:carbon-nitrogen hydrolase family protein [Thiofilum flexile]|uniref:carbon-nitrogen hydrolase family protein n=1 Tax=Thiofilum flexile TaxID=125627 RepID=UPI00036E2896|nr:carbon-nitrogen hydrolase family protein [Thiofilum flexile]
MRIALVQCSPRASLALAVSSLTTFITQAKAQQASLLIVPEMFLTGYNIGAEACRAQALSLQDPRFQALQALAREHQIALVIGFPERDQDTIYNSAAFIDEQGQVLGRYRKTHLYGSVDQAQFSAGISLCQPFTWQCWQCALAICYDIEFPEVARSYALQGVELLLVPTANMHPFDLVCRHIIPTRAAENTLYIAYANYVGREDPFEYCGQSCICDPSGQVLARANSDAEILLLAELDKATLQTARESLTYLTDRRSHLYQL